MRSLCILTAILISGSIETRPAEACGIKLLARGKAMGRGKQVIAKREANALAAKRTDAPVRVGPTQAPVRTGGRPTVAAAKPAEPAQPTTTTNDPNVVRATPEQTAPAAKPESPPAVAKAEPAPKPAKPAPTKSEPAKPMKAETTTKAESGDQVTATPAEPSSGAVEAEVFFNSGAYTVDASESSLDAVVEWLKANPKKSITIEGYADPVGAAGKNLELSRRRAQSVKDLLVARSGVSGSLVKVVPRGETGLAYPNDDARNRRVLVKTR